MWTICGLWIRRLHRRVEAVAGLRNGGAKIAEEGRLWRAYSFVTPPNEADRREATTMEDHAEDKWLSRQELAERYGLPAKTPAEWASKGTGPRYAKFGPGQPQTATEVNPGDLAVPANPQRGSSSHAAIDPGAWNHRKSLA
jgi:hypothetical protein